MNKIYANLILQAFPRLFSLIDQEETSFSYGSFDRNFWHYKFITDYPCARYQEACLFLALIYKYNFKGNIYYKSKKILSLLEGALLFWCKIQNKDGSFNEAYPEEHSFVATSFTLYAVSEVYLELKEEISSLVKDKLMKAFKSTGEWISKTEDLLVANHTAGAVTALYNLYLITENNFFKTTCLNHLKILISMQDKEGWFLEYKGADPGYLSLTISYLAKYYKKSKDKEVLAVLERSINFLSYFFHPDGSFGGDYGSRNTRFFYPLGLEILKDEIPKARDILSFFYLSLKERKFLNPINLDDRYFCFDMVNYLESALESKEELIGKFEILEDYKNFENAGILIINNHNYYAVLNYKKGGVLKIFSKEGELIFSESGYLGKYKNISFSSQFPLANYEINLTEMKINIKTSMFKLKRIYPLVKFLIPFRLFNYTLGKFKVNFFNKILKEKLFLKFNLLPITLKREFVFKAEELIIKDEISTKCKLKFLKKVKNLTLQHTSSANYFLNLEEDDFENLAPKINLKSKIEIKERLFKINQIWEKEREII